MKLKISENADPNYLAVVVTIPEIKPHPNADRLQLVEIFGNTVIIAKDMYTVGEKVVYFPVESCLSLKFLSWANLFEEVDKNADGKTRGFFQKHGRVKAIALRSIPSQGFLFKAHKLAEYYKCRETDFGLGDSFDTVGEDLLVTKYIRPTSNSQGENVKKNKIPKWINSTLGYLPRPIRKAVFVPIKYYYGLNADEGIKSRIVEGQFKFHYKTEHLGKNIWVLNPNDHITISSKMHGTSAIFGNILCKRNKTLTESLLGLFGKKYPETEYVEVYSSRSVLKNRRDGRFTDDVWGRHMNELSGQIPEGITLFGEIVGYASPGKCIQSMGGKGYDYGCPLGESALRVYRVTYTDKEGIISEYDFDGIRQVCFTLGLETVPVYYEGLAQDLFPDIPLDENWGAKWLDAAKTMFLDKKCEICTTGVINEGVVLKNNSRDGKPVYKFKSPKFIIGESAARDTGEEDMEEES